MGISLEDPGWNHMNTPRIHPQVECSIQSQIATKHTFHSQVSTTRSTIEEFAWRVPAHAQFTYGIVDIRIGCPGNNDAWHTSDTTQKVLVMCSKNATTDIIDTTVTRTSLWARYLRVRKVVQSLSSRHTSDTRE
jgi:hypothetical protein